MNQEELQMEENSCMDSIILFWDGQQNLTQNKFYSDQSAEQNDEFNKLPTVVSSSNSTWSYSLIAVMKMIASTLSVYLGNYCIFNKILNLWQIFLKKEFLLQLYIT